jgi:hypothetical protein
MKLVGAALVALLVSGCAYRAENITAPAYDVVTSYTKKIGGKWLLYVDASRFDTTVRPSEFACSAHNFPVALSSSFATSLRQTLQNVVDQLEEVDAPIPSDQIAAHGARGLITVRAESFDSSLRVVPGFWSANIVTEVGMSAAVTVDGRRGRLFGKTIDGQGKGDMDAGFACAGGAQSLKGAIAQAMRELLRRTGEEIGNAERIRAGT